MITSIDRKEHMDFKSEAGDAAWLPVDDYVVKPIDPKTLLSKVEHLAASHEQLTVPKKHTRPRE
jgi:DNA-binding response OmpR family regulator